MKVLRLSVAVNTSQPEWRYQALLSMRDALDRLEGKPDEAWNLIETPNDRVTGVRVGGPEEAR